MGKVLWTVGHSTRAIDEYIRILKSYDIELVVDVRTIPRSRKNPQFNKDDLKSALAEEGIEYIHEKELGGLRHSKKDSPNTAWRNESFRGFADYMQTPAFSQALARLAATAQEKRTVIMCAETLPWRCHRSLIADALIADGFKVIEIFKEGQSRQHKLTPFAVVEDEKVTYPAPPAVNVA